MNTSRPPALATWLLNRFAPGGKRESLIGDLIEQHHAGRSSAWYWRQSIGAIGGNLAAMLWTHKWVAIGVVALDAILPHLYLSFISRWVTLVESAWYPRLMDWLIETEWNTVRHAVYGLATGLTGEVAWCGLIASVAWVLVRLRPGQRRTILALFVLSDVGQCIPGLQGALAAWLHHPANLIGFLGFFRFSIFTFVAIPFSVLWAGRAVS